MNLSIIAAVGKKGEIGIGGKTPWNIPEDLKRFSKLTRSHSVIMGRKTFDSILKFLGGPLPDRNNIIITRNENYIAPPECTVVNSLEEALINTINKQEVFVIGGSEIYKQAMPLVKKMYLTHIDKEFEADTYFPKIDPLEWKIIEASYGHRAEIESTNFSYLVYERIDSNS